MNLRIVNAALTPREPDPITYPLGALAQLDPNGRVLEPRYNYANLSVLVNARQVGGYEPFMLRRYAELMQLAQGQDPDAVLSGLQLFRLPEKLLALLGVEQLVDPNSQRVLAVAGALPRLQLLTAYEVHTGRDAIVQRLLTPGFNPRSSVILEQDPVPEPSSSVVSPDQGDGDLDGSTVTLLAEGTDFMQVEVRLSAPKLLVLRENYSRYFRVTPLSSSPQEHYQVLPANYVHRAIPLAAGSHTLRIEYVPPFFSWAISVSCVALLLWTLMGLAAFASAPLRRLAKGSG